MTKSETAVVSYQNYKQSNYESKTIQLSSPMLHIGGEVSRLNPFEYVHYGKKIYFPNQELLAKAIYKQGRKFLDDYIDVIANQREPINIQYRIKNLMRQALGEDWYKTKTEDNQVIFPGIRPIWSQVNNPHIGYIRPMIRNGMGELYIPGSSIKGAIRTAIAYHLLKHADKYQVIQEKKLVI